MTKIWDKLKLDPWDYEIAALSDDSGMPWHLAQSKVVMKWP